MGHFTSSSLCRIAASALLASAAIHSSCFAADPLTAGKPSVIVVCVQAAAVDIQEVLESRMFFPTAYYPQLISSGAGRADGVQYTRTSGHSIPQCSKAVSANEWPEARQLIQHVLDSSPE